MSKQTYRIVSAEDSEIHDEPHIEGSRITVRYVHERIEKGEVGPKTFANQHDLDIADVYEALAYYHANPDEMRRAERRHEQAVVEAKERSSLEPPER
jgi:uncharacterized protein (DUF433 family)